jgi:hypothetical protein
MLKREVISALGSPLRLIFDYIGERTYRTCTTLFGDWRKGILFSFFSFLAAFAFVGEKQTPLFPTAWVRVALPLPLFEAPTSTWVQMTFSVLPCRWQNFTWEANRHQTGAMVISDALLAYWTKQNIFNFIRLCIMLVGYLTRHFFDTVHFW